MRKLLAKIAGTVIVVSIIFGACVPSYAETEESWPVQATLENIHTSSTSMPPSTPLPVEISPTLGSVLFSFIHIQAPTTTIIVPVSVAPPLPPMTLSTAPAVPVVPPFTSAVRRIVASPVAYRRVKSGKGRSFVRQVVAATWPAHLVNDAVGLAMCESTGNPNAANKWGFKGLFQFGRREWRAYGDGGDIFNAYHNSAAAYRYFKKAGWGPWECRPNGTVKANYG